MKHCFCRKREGNILIIIVFIGLLLRLWGIKQDLPYNYYGDESYLIYNSLKFGTGDFNPHWFIWPTLFQYILFFLFGVFYVTGLIFGWFKHATDIIYLYFKDPTVFFLIGRIISAIFGTASIWLVYLVAKKTYNKNTGLITACIFSFLPLAVEYSHYATVDTAMVFMILAALIFIINIVLYARLKDYLLAGFFSGLAFGTKYPALLLVLPIVIAHFFASRGQKDSINVFNYKIILCLIFIFLGFFLACPFAILDFPNFFSDIKMQLLCARIGWFGWEEVNPYAYHVGENLKSAIGLPLLFFSITSLIYLMVQRRRIGLVMLMFPAAYFLFIGLDKNTYARFMLPVLPFLSLFSAKLLLDLRDTLLGRSNIFFYGLLAFLLFSPIYTSIKADLKFSLPNTLTLAKDWIEKNIPSGSRILLNESGPPLIQRPDRIRLEAELKPEEQLRYAYHKKRDLFYQVKEEVAAQKTSYPLTYLNEPIGYLEGDTGYEQAMARTQEAIAEYSTKYDFIIINESSLDKLLRYPKASIPKRYQKLRIFYLTILGNYQPVKVFLAKKNTSKGPKIKVYKFK